MRLAILLISLLFPALAGAAASYQLLTPRYISVPGGESQDVSIRLLDAAGRPSAGEVVEFNNDVCGAFAGSPNPYVADVKTDANGVATVHFTASNPPGITCWIRMIATGVSAVVDVLTYRLSESAVLTSTSPVEPRPGRQYTLRVTPAWAIYSLKNVDVTARVVRGTIGAALNATTLNTGDQGFADFVVTPDDAIGSYSIEVSYRTKTATYSVTAPANPWQDMWWTGGNENGWGLSIVQHRDQLFTVIYAYDVAGKPTWYVMSGGSWDASGKVFTGAAYAPKGSFFQGYDASKFSIGAPVGMMRLTFLGANRATLNYTLDGRDGYKEIERDEFAVPDSGGLRGVGDMWWAGAAQNGWGIAILQQYRGLFIVLYTYDANGAPTWYYMPAGSWSDDSTYGGRICRSTSSPWVGVPYDPAKFQSTDVGSFRLRFSGDNATFDYTLEGHGGTIPVSRTPF